MPKHQVETDLIVHCKVKVTVDADNVDDAIDLALAPMPSRYQQKGWSATVAVKPPKGVNLEVVKAYYFENASGSEKAKKVSS